MNGDGKSESVLLLCILALQKKILKVQDVFTITVLNNHPEWLHPSMDLLIPLEVRCNGQVHLHT